MHAEVQQAMVTIATKWNLESLDTLYCANCMTHKEITQLWACLETRLLSFPDPVYCMSWCGMKGARSLEEHGMIGALILQFTYNILAFTHSWTGKIVGLHETVFLL